MRPTRTGETKVVLLRISEPQAGGFGQAGHDIEVLDAGAACPLAKVVEPRDEACLAGVGPAEDEQHQPVAAVARSAQQHFAATERLAEREDQIASASCRERVCKYG